jgi:hypothetical protein
LLVTAPPIARLLLRGRVWAWRRLKAGDFGPIVRRQGRAFCVTLAGVEAYVGRPFSPDQLAAAGLRCPKQEEFDGDIQTLSG